MSLTLRQSLPGFLTLVLIMSGAEAVAVAAVGDSVPRQFFERHCFKCHGPEKQKGDLRLDTLSAPTALGEIGKTLVKVIDALESGEMPPKKEPRPEAAALEQVLRQLSAAVAKIAGPPPIALRRLNRVEYENAVQDLLGIDTPLAELLPEDGSVQGFDNVSDGLSISTVLMERYLEAADAAFDGVIRRIKPLPATTRRAVMMEAKENIESVKKKKGGTIEVENSFVKFTPGWPPARLDSAHPIEGGIYRCRIAVWPHEPSQRTLVTAVYVGPLFGPGKRRFMGMYDVTGTPENPRIIEFTTRIEEGHALHIVPWIYPVHITYRDKHEPRPGIAIVSAETYGPLDQSWPSEAQKRLFGESDSLSMVEGRPIYMRHRKGVKLHYVESKTPREDAARIIREFVPRAFRRPVDKSIVDQFVTLTLERLDENRTFEQAVRAGISAVLCSPYFLLLNRDNAVDDFTLASRLSYFLWSTMPDAELLRLAAAGKLRDSKVRRVQVERMIKDPRINRFVENFTGQWLNLRDIEFTTPDKKLYPEFDELLQESMLGETRGFFSHILTNDLSVMNFVKSDFTVLNERMANHYGIPGVKGHEQFNVVKLANDSVRGGVLSHASVLKVTANGTSSSPVLRGVWVLDHILGRPSPPPPSGVPAVEPDIRGATTIREQLNKHRENESCARCHARIDPPGFALDCFDPIGGLRDRYRSLGEGERVGKMLYRIGRSVETGGAMADGTAFADFRSFREILLKNQREVARAIARKLLIYGTGRPVGNADRAAIDAVVTSVEKNALGLRTMIHAVVDSELFLQP